ncbi:hypothetical protein CYMTET_21812 [Cymbomonas tetramitiformis]|uniref:Uncharacterized protein n=1 Tax=Cymbomonas tetramitiformis TaxID=36881 RepID=A0AAE0G242_9CHLO|nr:hypothetical protein CYMTET_21812 [Cymbomonas tetramitiformis]|eukprot:gene21591-25970_t
MNNETTFFESSEVERAAVELCEKEAGGIWVSGRDVLPTVPSTAEFDVRYAEKSILGLAGGLLSLTHSYIILTRRGQDSQCPPAMTFQYFAVYFGAQAILPRLVATPEGKNLEWSNDSVVCYTPSDLTQTAKDADKERWMVSIVGTCSGDVFNEWCEWVALYEKRQPGYQLWDVWDHHNARIAKKYIEGSKCDDFSQRSLLELSSLGARLDTQTVLYQNSFTLLTQEPPRLLDMSKPAEALEVVSFYEQLATLLAQDETRKATLPETLRTIATTLDKFIVYERATNTYHRVILSSPYIRVDKLYQRMYLPWQSYRLLGDSSAASGEPEAGLLSRATSVLRRRLPDVALSPKLRIAIRVGSIVVPIVSVVVPTWLWTGAPEFAAFYLAGLVNGIILMPILLLAYGKCVFPAKELE